MTDLMVEHRREGDRHVLTLEGDLAALNFEEFATPAVDALSDRSVRTLVLDLGGVSFIDSTGIGALVSLHGTAADVGAHLVLRNPTAQITALLHLIKMDTMFELDPPIT